MAGGGGGGGGGGLGELGGKVSLQGNPSPEIPCSDSHERVIGARYPERIIPIGKTLRENESGKSYLFQSASKLRNLLEPQLLQNSHRCKNYIFKKKTQVGD